jgi:ubiquinone/menaquinone biosynthesis C-methylase UbiE
MDPSDKETLQRRKLQHEGRDYKIYTRSMDAAIEAKAHSILSRFGEVPENATIVDIGSGTGKLAEYIARFYRNQNVEVYAVDVSHELLEIAENNRSFMNLVYGDATELDSLPGNWADISYHGTVGHEINTLLGEEGLQKALKATLHILKPGGREVWRDFAKPNIQGNVLMQIIAESGTDHIDEATTDGFLDYSKLSTQALFRLFHTEFLGGNAFEYSTVTIDGTSYIELPARFAHEFMLRKDYTANWRQEIEEEYLYWTPDDAMQALEDAGFVDVRVEPDDNEFIRTNRLDGKVAVYQRNGDELKELTFDTHMVVVGHKPAVEGVEEYKGPDPAVDYQKILDTIIVNSEDGSASIGDHAFKLDASVGMGAHKRVFKLQGEDKVIKIVRPDRPNTHNVFKAMLQMIERQYVLEEHSVPHMPLTSVDPEGPPYRFVTQEIIPDESQSAAELILNGGLTENDVMHMAEIVNDFELGKEWQLDTNPHNWYRVHDENGEARMVYIGGTVYAYDEKWEFSRVGLLQWVDTTFVESGEYSSSAIPKAYEAAEFAGTWATLDTENARLWRKYLSPALQP